MSRMKYLWAAALIALCVGVFAGAALAAAVPSWDPTATPNTIPARMIWDENTDVTVSALNDGLVTWDSTFSIESVLGTNPIDRWGVTSVPVTGLVVTDGTFDWDFAITAPPITGLLYPGITPTTAAISFTTPAVVASFDDNWDLAVSDVLQTSLPTAEAATVVSRFTDVVPSDASGAFRTQIEELAGRLPFVVGGFGDGTYRPADLVTRAQTAVFAERALQLGLPAYGNEFSDVPAGYWADNEIQACVDASIVQGFGDTTFRPEDVVTRDQMAVFIARGMAGGDANVTGLPITIAFDDVVPPDSAGFWALRYINYAAHFDVVQGFSPTVYQPLTQVDRAQMAVFVYRAFLAPTDAGVAVVLAGPGITSVDPDSAGYDGWSSIVSADDTTPAFAYIGLDAVRMQGAVSMDVKFELRNAATPTTVAVGAYTSTVSLDPAVALADLKASSGNPYAYASWDIPVASLADGSYILVVSVNGVESARQPAFSVVP